ncbi:MAG: LacI family transcriptional regulator, partial [Duncaniella sp.]|nr:LacI family transcriptional regulator [Duncaniella sp.]
MNSHITIKDIAKALGISTSTVSRALSDAWDVKRETRDQVLEMARKLNYHPNLNAKNLQNKRTGTIGIIIPEFVSSFFPNVVMGIQDVLYTANYHIFITQSGESRSQELDNM